MKKTLLFAAIAAFFTFTSCQKEDIKVRDKNGDLVFTATIDQGVKTTLNAQTGVVSWVSGDEITIEDAAKTAVKYTVSSVDAQGKATFTKKTGETESLGDGPYKAAYGSDPATAQTYSSDIPSLPMSAESATTELTFSVTCGLLEVSLTAANDETTKDVKTIEIVGIPTDSTLTIYTLTCAQAQDISSAKTFYIALPAGSYTVMKFTNSTGHICSRPATAAMALAANTIEPRTVSGIKFNDILSGNFSVSSTAKVRFAKGNLYYNGSAFKFEDNQYSSATSRSDASHISHFYWSKNASVAYASAYSDGSRAASDVIFTNATATTPKSDFTVNGETGVWRTLSGTDSGEWVYLLLTRTVNGGTGIGNSYRMATIRSDVSGGVLGMLIYPDNYTAQTTATSYTSDEWATMESAGCVFLPATGCWTGDVYTPKNTVIDVGKTGYYWTSLVAAAENAFRHLFESNRFEYPTGCSFRSTGHSLRLVCDVQ